MKAVVVYESLWGNTAAVARAIAEGIGEGAVALDTDSATPERVADADLVVAGAPILGFSLPTEQMRDTIARDPKYDPKPDMSHPSIRSWAASLPSGDARFATFETRIWWSFGSAAGTLATMLAAKGYRQAGTALKAIVKGATGPLKDGELARAKAWGAELARSLA